MQGFRRRIHHSYGGISRSNSLVHVGILKENPILQGIHAMDQELNICHGTKAHDMRIQSCSCWDSGREANLVLVAGELLFVVGFRRRINIS